MIKIGDEVVVKIKIPHLYNKIAIVTKILKYNIYNYNYEILIDGSHIWVRDLDIAIKHYIKIPAYFLGFTADARVQD